MPRAITTTTLAAVLLAAAGCHDLELTRFRCSVNGRCPDGYACGADGFCAPSGSSGGDGGAAARTQGQPPPPAGKKQGEACASDDDCAGGSCADGVCCNGRCDDACHACNQPNNVGTCVAVARGKHPAHGSCAKQDPSTCGTNGLCDGAGQCQRYDTSTVCRASACDQGTDALTPEARCDGLGSCVPSGPPLSCAPFVCRGDGKRCADSCAGNGDCQLSASCAGGSCGKFGNGLPCSDAGQCQSGFCVDGVCCNVACGDQCTACDVAGSLGTCAQVPSGSPHGARPACAATDAACAGQCTPASATACTYPAGETVCRSASCTEPAGGAVQTAAATCNGQGACGSGAATGCGAYLCGPGGACATSCAGDVDCAGGFACFAGHCQAKGMAAAPCTASSQCAAGLTCRDGVCCDGACDGACRACNLPGQEGHCAPVVSAADPDTCPMATSACDAAGACKLTDGQACNAPADCLGGACVTFYPDQDGDSFGDRTATLDNGKARSFCGGAGAPAKWVTDNSDCCDMGKGAMDVHPGQTAWFTMPGPCGVQFDYDCDGVAAPQYPSGGSCVDGGSCAAAFTAAVACGDSGDYQSCAMPAMCAPPMKRPQGCH